MTFKLSDPIVRRSESPCSFTVTHFAGKELQSGEKMERAIQPERPSPSGSTEEHMREHREAITGTRLKSQWSESLFWHSFCGPASRWSPSNLILEVMQHC